ncbi:MAG: glycosyl hydrolase family 88 [Chlorobi bacterium OLB5]|nr:MAG: glycosyl hydrolase family 88 [Chlorobi bacterium OLB5]
MTSGDAPNGSTLNYTEHKLGILSLIIGKDLKNTNTAINNQPNQFRLHQNYPNPFNPTTSIRYDIPQSSQITIKVYDILGKEVFSFNEYKLAGSYEVKFDGSNLASGMYFYSIKAETSQRDVFTETKKKVLLK